MTKFKIQIAFCLLLAISMLLGQEQEVESYQKVPEVSFYKYYK